MYNFEFIIKNITRSMFSLEVKYKEIVLLLLLIGSFELFWIKPLKMCSVYSLDVA